MKENTRLQRICSVSMGSQQTSGVKYLAWLRARIGKSGVGTEIGQTSWLLGAKQTSGQEAACGCWRQSHPRRNRSLGHAATTAPSTCLA